MSQPFPIREPVMCVDCDKTHSWPIPKFANGQNVKIISQGVQHNDKIGEVVNICGLNDTWSMPCDEVEYITSAGFGSIKESRLELA